MLCGQFNKPSKTLADGWNVSNVTASRNGTDSLFNRGIYPINFTVSVLQDPFQKLQFDVTFPFVTSIRSEFLLMRA